MDTTSSTSTLVDELATRKPYYYMAAHCSRLQLRWQSSAGALLLTNANDGTRGRVHTPGKRPRAARGATLARTHARGSLVHPRV